MNKKRIIFIVFVLLLLLHQDFWNWDNANLVFGFMPVGLFYHACYSLVAALFWGIVIKVAWPTELEEWAEGTADPQEGGTE
ncbi:MAG: hypothetical protein OSB05_05510 [Akkermansiaceae bacterium]|mgnify:FL=1|nr:hypothetical protein [Akkermansiaceae bacterium]|tara:strand:- start:1872 stop:2114 length:243 start_codon:yes stop_codon:yes gene_type:complete